MREHFSILVFAIFALVSCGQYPSSRPPVAALDASEAVVADGGAPNGCTAAIQIASADEGTYQTQDTVHRWVNNDIFQYEVTLKYYSGSTWVDFTPALVVIVPRKVSPKTKAYFTNLKQGRKYQAYLTAKGNIGGSAAATILNSTPATSIFDFTATNDVQDTLTNNMQIAFDNAPFNGTGTATMLTPLDGGFQNPTATESGVAQ